jgi:hypothetical protein
MSKNTKSLTFKRLRETKNTVRFEEETDTGKPPVIGTIYIQKWFIGDAAEINVTITPEGN